MNILNLSPTELKTWQNEHRDFVLLDVREDHELQIASLSNITHIVMNSIPLRHNELPDDKPIVVYCHHGRRSLQVALFLEQAGFTQLYNLTGGIDAWSEAVDSNIPRY